MSDLRKLQQHLHDKFADVMSSCKLVNDELTMVVPAEKLLVVAKMLRDEPDLGFDMLMDVCGVDYSTYGVVDWQTESATATGFDRGVKDDSEKNASIWTQPRFAVVYHLLSIQHNHRLRLRVFATDEPPMVDSVIDIWKSADWFEREAFDMFGIYFRNHPDLRRILTDYGFVGHPFRKDFPLSGHVEVRYDAAQERVVYQPVTIEPRTLVPRVIRKDSRYLNQKDDQEQTNVC